jgi:fumarylacetoacetase
MSARLGSWVEGADDSDWPLTTLPYGVADSRGAVVRIGDQALPLAGVAELGLLDAQLADPRACFAVPALNHLMELGPATWAAVRARLTELLAAGSPERARLEPLLLGVAELDMTLPIAVADYVDFYSSREHATNLGRLFRPDSDPLLSNWHHLPVGYHGRSGTFVTS